MSHTKTLKTRGQVNLVITIAATIAIGLLVNTLLSGARLRVDLTENSINLLSEASRDAARALDGLEVRVYISPDLPESIPMGGGRDLKLAGLPQKLEDKLAEYAAYAPGMRVVRVSEDLLGEAERNRLKTFTGKGGALSDSGRFEFRKYVFGLSFHYKNQVEVFELALQPEHFEFEITRRLSRLKDKADFAITMKDVLEAAQAIGDRAAACVSAIDAASDEGDEEVNPLAILSGEGNERRLAAMKAGAETMQAACAELEAPLSAARAVDSNLEAFQRVILIADALKNETAAFVASLGEGETPPMGQLLSTRQRLLAIGRAIGDEVRAVEDAPGQRAIGFVCNARSFCPFPDPEPLYPPELAQAMGSNPGMMQQQLAFLDRLQEQIAMILQQINQGLFKGRGFDIVRVDLDETLPDDLAALVVYGATADFSDWQLHQIDQFVLRGGSLVAFLHPWDVSLQRIGKGGQVDKPSMTRRRTNLTELLAHHGMKPTGALVLEPKRHGELALMQFLQQGERLVPFQSVPVPYPMLPTFVDMDSGDPLVRATPSLTLPFTTWFELSDRPGVEHQALVRSSTEAASVNESDFPLDPRQQQAAAARHPKGQAMPVVVSARGELTSFFKDKERPNPPPSDEEGADNNPTPPAEPLDRGTGRIVAIGTNLGLTSLDRRVIFDGFEVADLMGQDGKLLMKLEDFRMNFEHWSSRLDQVQHTLQGNLQFLQNVLDWSVQRDAIAELRSRQYTERPLELTDSGDQSLYRTLGVALSPLLLIAFGALWTLRRRARRRSLAP